MSGHFAVKPCVRCPLGFVQHCSVDPHQHTHCYVLRCAHSKSNVQVIRQCLAAPLHVTVRNLTVGDGIDCI